MQLAALTFCCVSSFVGGLRLAKDSVYSQSSTNTHDFPDFALFDPWAEDDLSLRSLHLSEPQLPAGFLDAVNQEIGSHFQSRHSAEPFAARLDEILLAGRMDPSHAVVLSNGFGWTGGYGSRILMFFNEMSLALYFGKSVAVCNSTFLDSVWREFYEVPVNVAIYNDPDRTPGNNWYMDMTARCSSGFMLLGSESFSPAMMVDDFAYMARMKRFLYQSLMTLKPAVEEEITSTLAAAGFHKGTPYLGVHIRHGDKAKETRNGLLETEVYARAIQKELKSNGMHAVYVASDDPHAAETLKESLGPEVLVWQSYDKHSNARKYSNRASVMAYLTDLEALRQATVFIGTQSSNTGRLVYYGRSENVKSISLEGEWQDCPKVTSDAVCH